MGLFGLFGSKKSEAQKAYEKTPWSRSIPGKGGTVEEWERAAAAWEAADGPQTQLWEGYFRIAICYDCGYVLGMDEAAGRKYHDKARGKINGSGDNGLKEWADSFYFWYNQSAVNSFRPLSRQTLNLRRLGNALMHVIGNSRDTRMLSDIKEVLNYTNILSGESGMVSAFQEYAASCSYTVSMLDKMLKDHNDNPEKYKQMDLSDVKKYEKRTVKENKQWNKAMEKHRDKPYEEMKKAIGEEMDSDSHCYVYGFQFYHSAPLCFMYVFHDINDPVSYGIGRVFDAAISGNTMALHELMYAAYADKESYRLIESALSSRDTSLENFFKERLPNAIDAGDETGRELLNRYLA